MDKDKASGPIQPNIPKMISYPCTAMRLISYRLRHSNKTLYLSAMLVILLFLGACGGGGGRPCTGLGVLANPLCTPVKQPKNPSNLSIFDWRGKDLGTQTLRGPQAQLYRNSTESSGIVSYGGRLGITPGRFPRDRIEIAMDIGRSVFVDFCCVYTEDADRIDPLGGTFDAFVPDAGDVLDPDSIDRESLTTVTILNTDFGGSGLDYITYGFWELLRFDEMGTVSVLRATAFAFGFWTDVSDIPTQGTANYSGRMDGLYSDSLSASQAVTGTFNLNADFSAKTISGQMANIDLADNSFRDIDLSAVISGGNSFVGTATTAPVTGSQIGPDMSGTLLGKFYGPAAEETGAAFEMSGGGALMVGAVAGQR